MTDAYFYVNIPYHRPATPSFFRLLQRWAGPLLLGSVLAGLAWRQDHQTPAPAPTTAQAAIAASSSSAPVAPAQDPQGASDLNGYSAVADGSAAPTQALPLNQTERASAHPALVFHNCSMPRMEVRKDHNELITGVASVSSCDEAKITLWDTSR